MQVNSWAPTLIYRNDFSQFKDLNSYFIEKAEETKEKNSKVTTNWSCDTYNTHGLYDFLKDKKLKKFILACESEVNGFSKYFGVSKPAKCVDAWINVSSPGDYQEYHIHPLRHFSLVYYVKSSEDSGNIRFKFNNSNDMFPLPVDNYTDASFDDCYYKPEESSLLIFRSNLQHMVEKNKSQEDRISVALNFVCI